LSDSPPPLYLCFHLSRCALPPPPRPTPPLSLHDALPISADRHVGAHPHHQPLKQKVVHASSTRGRRMAVRHTEPNGSGAGCAPRDRKSTRLNSSHVKSSYAVFCLKKKKTKP